MGDAQSFRTPEIIHLEIKHFRRRVGQRNFQIQYDQWFMEGIDLPDTWTPRVPPNLRGVEDCLIFGVELCYSGALHDFDVIVFVEGLRAQQQPGPFRGAHKQPSTTRGGNVNVMIRRLSILSLIHG